MAVLNPNLPLEKNLRICRKQTFNVLYERYTIATQAAKVRNIVSRWWLQYKLSDCPVSVR